MLRRRSFLSMAAAGLAPQWGSPIPAGMGHAQNSVNATIFCQPVTSSADIQYLAWYALDGKLMLARRKLASRSWTVAATDFTGNIRDAHNGISLGVDGAGTLHVAWDHHGNPLRYARSREPGSLDLTQKISMNGELETRVTYPEFFPLPGGDLLFLYRSGASGRGDTVLKRYEARTQRWSTVAGPLIAGGEQRNAYTNRLAVAKDGSWHLSWCWRDTGDAATNHDVCYAVTRDQGNSWQTSTGGRYVLPIRVETAEVVRTVPRGSDLINTGTMTTDSRSRPVLATYWREPGEAAPQYRMVRHDGSGWRMQTVGRRTLDFRLGGLGARRLPMSRPLVVMDRSDRAIVVVRDEGRGNGIYALIAFPPYGRWDLRKLHDGDIGHWEPTCDAPLWAEQNRLHLFYQRVGQGDAEGLEDIAPQAVSVLEATI